MIEKFSDYEGGGFLNQAGEFVFEITDCQLTNSSSGNPMAVLTAKSSAGQTTLYHSLSPKARWSYNNLIKACLKLDTPEKIAAFELDYETIGQKLIGTKFKGKVEVQQYNKTIKTPLDDGTFDERVEVKDSYKVTEYAIA